MSRLRTAPMKYFKIKYVNGDIEIVSGTSMREVIEQHNLYSAEHMDTRIFELSGEQLAVARANDEEY